MKPDLLPAFSNWPAGGGETGALIRTHDWAATPLGPIDAWPVALRTLVDLVVHSPIPMLLMWGPELIQLYNDAYATICGPRHPRALGQPTHECWPEVRGFAEPLYARVFAGESVTLARQHLVLQRKGVDEDAWFDSSMSPAYDGAIQGVMATVIEVTDRERVAGDLQLNDERFRAFASASASVVYRMSPDWSEMHQLDGQGVLRDNALSTPDWMGSYVHPEDQPDMHAAIERAVRTRSPFELEHRAPRADGTLGWMRSRAVPLFDEHGAIREWFGAASDITEKKRAAEELRRADQRVAMALDAGAVAGTWYWDVVNDHFTADTRFARCFSLDPLAMRRGVKLAEVVQSIHPDDEARVAGLIGQALAQGGRYRAEYRVRQPDGRYRWIEANGHVAHDQAGRPVTFPGVLVDIEERKRGETRQAALLRLGDRLRLVDNAFEATAIASEIVGDVLGVARAGFGLIDPVAATVDIMPEWCADPGIASVAGLHHFAHYGSYLADLLRGDVVAIADVAHDPRTAATSAALHALDIGALLNVPLMGASGLAGVFLGHHVEPHTWTREEIDFVKGVADRLWAEITRADATQALRALNQRLERQVAETTTDRNRLWNLSQDIMLVARLDGRVMAVNPAWEETLGWTEQELLGAQLGGLIHPEDLPATIDAAAELAATGRLTAYFENRYRHRDGSYRWISWKASQDGELIAAVGRDVTQDKEHAATLLAIEEKLRHSQKMEAVGQLTGGLAHDFNNLLASIGGSLELLALRIKSGDLRELDRFTGIAQSSVRRAAALTHRLLAFSRRQPLDARPSDADRLVAGMLDLVRRTIGPAIVLEVSSEDGLWPILVDPNQLENALLNLCINARDAMPDGGRLRIAMENATVVAADAPRHDLEAGDYVLLSVSDTGTGMTAEVAAKAFDPFFTTKPIGQGTGLGLSMIYGFARQSGGTVLIDSAPGQGTTMRMYLPRCRDAAQRTAEPAVPAIRPVAAGASVLLVDDEAPLRAVMAEALERLGHAITTAGDAAGALRALDAGIPVDLLVTDIGLAGGMNGRQLAEAARAARPALKILFITGYAEARLVEHGSFDANTQVLIKPFELGVLAQRIADMTGQK
ncbi:PAS domain-containing protein [Massilia sp. TN1-12]|uniref:PAS domain-containing protein n=1 Tax=Massilia paldalensis TaxID=3377675 RepID=UPI00384E3403